MNLRWRLLIVAVVVLAVAIPVGIGVVVWHSGTPGKGGTPSAPPLTAVAEDQDRAVAAVLTAVGDKAAVAVTTVVPVRTCTVGAAQGWIYSRSADLYLDPGGENALIGAVASGLPSEYRRQRGTATANAAAPLTAEVGGSVTLTVAQLGAGWVAATAQSDCRAAPTASGTPAPAGSAAAAIAVLLNSLGTTVDSLHATTLPCTGGGPAAGSGQIRQTVTWSALSAQTDPSGLPGRLAPTLPSSARRFASPSNRLPWRDGHSSVIVAASDDGTHVTVQYTVDCS